MSKRKKQQSLAELAWGIRPLLRLAASYSATSAELLKLANGLGRALKEVAEPQKPEAHKPAKPKLIRKRKRLTAAQRKAISERMKASWAAKRKEKAA